MGRGDRDVARVRGTHTDRPCMRHPRLTLRPCSNAQTTGLYDRRSAGVSLGQVAKIGI